MLPRLVAIFLALVLLCSAAPVAAEQASVFVYHRFGEDRYPSTNISIDTFAAQLDYLRRQSYSVLTLGEIVRRLQSGRALPLRCACLTADDGYASFLVAAMPLLRHYGYPATLFISSDAVGRTGYLNWEELRSLAAEGVEIGNHTASHPYLLDKDKFETEADWQRRVRNEIVGAQQRLEQELGKAPALFAYPFGEYSPELAHLVQELGFLGGVAQQSGVVNPDCDFFALPRYPMGGAYATLDRFREKLGMRPLPVTVVAPISPVIGDEDPPTLVVDIAAVPGLDLSRLRCFVQGQKEAAVSADPDIPGRFVVRAIAPLAGRRGKYTLTAPAVSDDAWYWFSQLWVKPRR